MSAFMCTDRHIAYLMRAYWHHVANEGRCFHVGPDDLEAMARVLKYENARSVNHRYPGREPGAVDPCPGCGKLVCEPMYAWRSWHMRTATAPRPCAFAVVVVDLARGMDLDPVKVIKAAQCYQYQSNEHPEWEVSEARKITDRIIGSAICNLPGYDAAPWGIE